MLLPLTGHHAVGARARIRGVSSIIPRPSSWRSEHRLRRTPRESRMSVAVAQAEPRSSSAILPYASTIFLSAFLLFLVQPIIAKQILPWFGGSAAVWTTCLVFFQCVLLAGYAYADLTHRLGQRRQALLHIALLLLSLATLPVIASERWKPHGGEAPIVRILLLLAATIGLPYFLLATTTPLLQAWYWQRFRSAVPYRLFALSNFASLLALLGFPVLFEPPFSLPQLGWAWSALYAAFVVVCAATGWISARAAAGTGDRAPMDAAARPADAHPPSGAMQITWLALAAMGSIMLLSVTNHVTQNISSVPFLWVLPLSLYLLTFIFAFDHPRWYVRPLVIALLLFVTPLMAAKIAAFNLDPGAVFKAILPPSWAIALKQVSSLGFLLLVGLYMAGLFVACLFCHGELARLKPDPRYLTRFYLMLSLGGAAGAVLVAIVAPLTLPGYFELNIVLVLLAALLGLRLPGRPRVAGVAALIATAWFAVEGGYTYAHDVRVMARDFYGVVRTRDREVGGVKYRAMYHGGIVHGGQLLGPQYRNTPSDYFGPTSGYGRLFAALNAMKPGPRDVGVIGLGAGVIAAYGRAGDTVTFYEISPDVVQIERNEFSFLRDTPAHTQVILGDGRLSLEREQPPRKYDVLGIDAFAGDSIPMHLITREAMALYRQHLKENGVIVFQATNRYINLMPVIKRLASEAGMEAVLVSDAPKAAGGIAYWYSSTDQVLVTKDKGLLERSGLKEVTEPIGDRNDLATFTDAHHNLFRILK
jgi:spermidine synthase